MTTRVWWLVLASMFVVGGLGAQPAQDDDEETLTAGFDGSHAFIRSADGNFEMEFGGRLHLDYRANTADIAPEPTFVLRRARFEVEGAFYQFVEFKVQADFADDESTLLRDGYLNVHPNDAVQIMAGQFKAPFSQEEYIQSSKYIEFVERSMLNNLAPGRSPGVMFHGSMAGGLLEYAVSVQNDRGLNADHETDAPDVFGNVRVTPFGGFLKNLSLGTAIAHGRREGERFITGRTSSRSVSFFNQLPLNGTLDRFNFEGWWFHRNVKLQWEYAKAVGERQLLADVVADGYYVQGTYVLTGEEKVGNGGITPKRSVHEGGLGAWELGARYQVFQVKNANRATDLTLGLNWWLNPFLRYQANFSLEEFRSPPHPSTRETSNLAFVSRLGIFF